MALMSNIEKIYVLDVSNFLEDLYKDIPIEFHVYDTKDYFDTI
jgi:hypothetical protein